MKNRGLGSNVCGMRFQALLRSGVRLVGPAVLAALVLERTQHLSADQVLARYDAPGAPNAVSSTPS